MGAVLEWLDRALAAEERWAHLPAGVVVFRVEAMKEEVSQAEAEVAALPPAEAPSVEAMVAAPLVAAGADMEDEQQ